MKYRHVITAILFFILVNFVFHKLTYSVDVTSGKIYTFSELDRILIEEVDKPMSITLLLSDNLPPSYAKLRRETLNIIREIRKINPLISYEIFDPNSGHQRQIQDLQKHLASKGILPTNLRERTNEKSINQYVFPYIQVKSVQNDKFINILEPPYIEESVQDAIYRSISTLKAKITKAVFELSKEKSSQVAYFSVNGKLNKGEFELLNKIQSKWPVGLVNSQILWENKDTISVCILALNEINHLSTTDLLYLDQYIMNGGNILWMIEKFNITVDSIGIHQSFLPSLNDHQLVEDYFFHNGVKLQSKWIADTRATRIPQVVGQLNNQNQTEMILFPFHPLNYGNENHPISANMSNINMYFPTVIDTLKLPAEINKIPLLTSSEYTRTISYPFEFTFDFMHSDLILDKFEESSEITAILLEGRFQSYFKNKNILVSNSKFIKQNNLLTQSTKTGRQIIVSDVDFVISNNQKAGRIKPGYNKWERMTFGDNYQFVENALEYMLNGDRFVNSTRPAQITYASLDKKKVDKERSTYVLFNLLFAPIFLLLSFYLAKFISKKRRIL